MSGPHEIGRCPACGAEGEEPHSSDCRWVGNPKRKWTDAELDTLASRMWHAYIKGQPRDERSHYRKWSDLTDADTRRGFLALARVTLSVGWKQ